MRILTVLHNLGPGGTERVAQNYALGYRDAGLDSAVLAYAAGGVRADVLRAGGLPCFIGGLDMTTRAKAVAEAASWRPDLVHVHRVGWADSDSAQVLAVLRQISPHVRVMETNVFGKPDYSDARHLIDLHLHLTPWSLWKWQQWTRHLRPAPAGAVLPYGVDAAAFAPAPAADTLAFRRNRGIPEDAFLFGRIGQPHLPKWSPVIFDAFATVAARHPGAWLLLVGLPPELQASVEALKAGVRRRVVQIPFIQGDEALRVAYSALDVFLHAAHIGESFGMVFAEALLCGVPVITLSRPTHDNGQLYVVGHERGGLVVADGAAMTDAMERLLRDPALRARLARDGAAHVRAQYDLPVVMEQLIAAARTVHETPSGDALHQALHERLGLTITVSTPEIEALLGHMMGRHGRRERMIMHALHRPALYRLWLRRQGRA